MTHFSDTLRLGAAVYLKANANLGADVTQTFVKQFGQITTTTATGVCVGVTSTGAATLSATGSLVSGGVATFDVPRCVSITATSDLSGVTFTVTGTDEYSEALTQSRAGPNNTTVNTLKAFKTVSSVAVSAAATTAVNVGNSDIIGLPVRVNNVGQVLGVFVDGASVAVPSFVAAVTTAATATTGDVRGTILATTAPNGSRYFTTELVVTASTKENLYGVTQA